jgi:hypothetical protein
VSKASAETRVKKLQALLVSTNKLKVQLADVFVSDKAGRLKTLTAALKTVETLRSGRIVGTSKLLDCCANELTSLREGVFTGAKLLKRDFKLEAFTSAISRLEEMLATSKSKLERAEASIAEETGQPVLTAAGEDLAQFVIEKNLKEKAKLPKLNPEKVFVVGRAPVVIVTTPGPSGNGGPGNKKVTFVKKGSPSAFVNRTVLEKHGFQVDNLDGYAILHHQLVIGINKRLVSKTEEFLKSPEGKEDRKRLGIPKLEDIAKMVIASLTKANKKKYVLVTPATYGYDSAVWFWLMTETELNHFAKAFPGGHINLNQWGFAF